ncbi:hypothetical protein ACWCRD_18070 [Streptomyces sp. NPDC002092]
MRRHTGRAVGCGIEQAAGHAGSRVRARAVSDAGHGSRAAEVWAKGYRPVGDVIQLPDGGFRTEAGQRT